MKMMIATVRSIPRSSNQSIVGSSRYASSNETNNGKRTDPTVCRQRKMPYRIAPKNATFASR